MKFLFYPDLPNQNAVISKLCHINGWEITNDPHTDFNLVINWEDSTLRYQDENLKELVQNYQVINSSCTDISKQLVDRVHTTVFGYGLKIDPCTYVGLAVQKSDRNAAHDGVIINCPIPENERDLAIAEGYVFSLLINNAVQVAYPELNGEQCIEDIRVPYINGHIPLCYLKYRPVNNRFSNTNSFAVLSEIQAVLTSQEIEQVDAFCKQAGLQYGELDVLRNRDDGRIYIVDINNTPFGPPNHLSEEEGEVALKKMANTFKKAFKENKPYSI